ncbi:glycosyltransferase [Myxosarcina sp. GI1(2024)]
MVTYHRIIPNKIYYIFRNPNVFIVQGIKGINALLPKLKLGDWCFEGLMWFLTWRSALKIFKRWQLMKLRGVNYVVMANSTAEVHRCKLFKIPVCLMPQGQFINEDAFPLVELEKERKYDAFCAAQAKPFKRIHLAKDINNIHILTYSCPSNFDGNNDLSLFEPKLKHATWNSSYIHDLSSIIKLMHSSGCALALSRKEGATWAVTEAHMCGLPVVSTKSLGGRDRYFNSVNSTIVAANSKSVAKAVEFYKFHPPNPALVRKSTLELIEKDRQATAKYFFSEVLPASGWSIESIKAHLFSSDSGIGRFLVAS